MNGVYVSGVMRVFTRRRVSSDSTWPPPRDPGGCRDTGVSTPSTASTASPPASAWSNLIYFQVWDQQTVSTPPTATQDSFQDFLLELFLLGLPHRRTTTSRMTLKWHWRPRSSGSSSIKLGQKWWSPKLEGKKERVGNSIKDVWFKVTEGLWQLIFDKIQIRGTKNCSFPAKHPEIIYYLLESLLAPILSCHKSDIFLVLNCFTPPG